MVTRLLRTPLTWLVVAVLAVVAAFGLWWFQPWRLVTDTEVRDELSAVGTTGPAQPSASSSAAVPSAAPTPAGPTVVSRGDFITHEHETSGSARVVRTAEGTYRLELVDLDTSDGPDLRVWLTDRPVRTGTDGWRVFDDGRWVELGRLKGNRGDQVYEIPAGTDIDGLTSVSIWCKRFAVSFGAAALKS